jgi:hypothetical protein
MSAFIVGNDHIDALMTYCIDNRVSFWNGTDRVDITSDNAEEIGRILLDENVKSVHYRYEGRIEPDEKNAAADYGFRRFGPIEPLKAIWGVRCLEYQSCEHPEWENSIAWRISQAIIHEAIRHIPCDEGMWEITRKEAA